MFFLERNSGVLVAARAFAAHLLFNSGAWCTRRTSWGHTPSVAAVLAMVGFVVGFDDDGVSFYISIISPNLIVNFS